MSGRRVLCIHRDPAAAARNYLSREERDFLDDMVAERGATNPEFVAMVNDALARRGDGLRVEHGIKGTTDQRPWGVVADVQRKADQGAGP
jgi:hypothetical protein